MSQIKATEIEGDAAIGRHVTAGGDARISGHAVVKKNLRVEGWLEARNVRHPVKGMFASVVRLEEAWPRPHDGWAALVGTELPAKLYIAQDGEWRATGGTSGGVTVEFDSTVLREELGAEIRGKALASVIMSRDDSGVTLTFKNGAGEATPAAVKIPVAVWNGPGDNDGVAGVMSPYKVRILEEAYRQSKSNSQDIGALGKRLTDSVSHLQDDIDEITGSMGTPDGLATLDERGWLVGTQLNLDTVSVRVFHGFVKNVKTETVGVILKPGQISQVVYDTARCKFLLQVVGSYYDAWPEVSAYNGSAGEIPVNRLYVYAAERSIWWWNGMELTEITDRELLAELAENALRLSKICVFGGFVETTPSLSEERGPADMEAIFDKEGGVFVGCKTLGTAKIWCGSWLGNSKWGISQGTFAGVVPVNDRLYVCKSDHSMWVWNGETLVNIVPAPEELSRLESAKLDRSKINQPGGVAGLDESGKIDASLLPDSAQTGARGPLICVFDGWTDESPALGAAVPGQGRGEVIYDRERGTFVSYEKIGNSYRWFGEWTGDASFGEVLGPFQGVRPVADRFYFCPDGSGLWWWDGTQLIDVSGCSGSASPPAITPGEIDDLLQSPPAFPDSSDTAPPSITLDEIDELLRP